MTLTAGQCIQYVADKAGGDLTVLQGLALVNMAGEWLTDAHKWKFLEGRSSTLGTTAGQNYVTLPADFGDFIAYDATDGVVNSLHPTTIGHILALRSNNVVGNTGNFWFAITHDASVAGPPVPTMELDPAPTTTDATAFTIFYRARWNTLTTDTEKLTLPTHMELLFLEVCWAVYRGTQESDDYGDVGQALQQVRVSPLFVDAMRRDGRIQPSYGRLQGGYTRVLNDGYRRYLNTKVQGPS